LPFEYNFYGQTFSTANICPNGNIQFMNGDFGYGCVPFSLFNYALLAFCADLVTDSAGGGIFTSISGSAPNRIFNVEWRAAYFIGGATVNFELRLYEGQQRFDIIYAQLNGNNGIAGVGAQQDTGSAYTSFDCYSGGLSNGLQLTFQFQPSCIDGGGPCVT